MTALDQRIRLVNMEWAKPEYTKGQINRAGKTLVNPAASPEDLATAKAIVNNWRTSHSYPLNTFKVTLRKKAHDVDSERLVAQRIKRMSSIEAKLQRFPGMQLARMQDLGGCRAIVGTKDQVLGLVKRYQGSDLRHELDAIDNYIANPKPSGYRGVHMIYKYFSDKQAPSVYNGLHIEMQLRTRKQHAWATAVETAGTFLQQALKSSQGEEGWLRFFSLMGSVIALSERSPLVPDTPTNASDLKAEVRQLASELNVSYTLSAYQQAIHVAREGPQAGNYYYLLILEPSQQRITVKGFKRQHLDNASEEYLAAEQRVAGDGGGDAVLVSVDSIAQLERAYPNYFADTTLFLKEVQRAIA